MRNTYYRTCRFCGANLDPGERCDCRFDEPVPTHDQEAYKDAEFAAIAEALAAKAAEMEVPHE